MLRKSSRAIYGNCAAVDDDGELLFRCDTKKMEWYLRKGLAERVQNDPPRIRLLFEPGGPGHKGDPFFLQPRRNLCVVCGTEDDLTRHHILPHCYRRWFPRTLDVYGTYDVMALCTDDHERYEEFSWDLRRKLADEYDAPLNGVGGRACPNTRRAARAAYALMRYGKQIPGRKRSKLRRQVTEFFGVSNPTHDFLKEQVRKNRTPHKTHAQIVVEQIDSCHDALSQFVIRWRKHFVQQMDPQFLPDFWEIDRIFEPKGA